MAQLMNIHTYTELRYIVTMAPGIPWSFPGYETVKRLAYIAWKRATHKNNYGGGTLAVDTTGSTNTYALIGRFQLYNQDNDRALAVRIMHDLVGYLSQVEQEYHDYEAFRQISAGVD